MSQVSPHDPYINLTKSGAIREDGSLHKLSGDLGYIAWDKGDRVVILDGDYTAEDLKQIAAWMEAHS